MGTRSVWVCSGCHEQHDSQAQADRCCTIGIEDPSQEMATETSVLRALARAVDEIVIARETTRNGLLDDHCANALRELRSAMQMAVGGE